MWNYLNSVYRILKGMSYQKLFLVQGYLNQNQKSNISPDFRFKLRSPTSITFYCTNDH